MSDPRELDLIRWSEALAGIARTGLGFTESLFERERYEEVLRVAADIRAAADSRAAADIRAGTAEGAPEAPAAADGRRGDDADPESRALDWLAQVRPGVAGYVTPKAAVGAVVGDDEGRLLLIQRADSGVWLYPTGWADVGYSPAEVAVKEVEEETGVRAEPVRVIAVFDGLRFGKGGLPFYSIVFQLRACGGDLKPHPLEARDVGWFAEDALPSPLARGSRWRELAFAAVRGEPLDVYYDDPRDPVWRGSEP